MTPWMQNFRLALSPKRNMNNGNRMQDIFIIKVKKITNFERKFAAYLTE